MKGYSQKIKVLCKFYINFLQNVVSRFIFKTFRPTFDINSERKLIFNL